jgi:hypothetical protein
MESILKKLFYVSYLSLVSPSRLAFFHYKMCIVIVAYKPQCVSDNTDCGLIDAPKTQ